MIDRYLQLTIDVLLGGVSLIAWITFGGILPMIASILSILWFVNLFKTEIEKKHNGSIKQWMFWFLRKQKKKQQ